MIRPNFKISLRKGKLKIKSEKTTLNSELKKKFEPLSVELSKRYYNLLIESYLEDFDKTIQAVENLSSLLLNECLTRITGDAYIILEKETRYPPVSLNILGKKITLAYNGYKKISFSQLGGLFCHIQDKISPQNGFTLKTTDTIDYGKLVNVIKNIQTSNLFELTVLTNNLDIVDKIAKKFRELNYIIVKGGYENIFVYQKNLGYIYVVFNESQHEESFILDILEDSAIDTISPLDLVEIKGSLSVEDIKKVILFAKRKGYTRVSLMAEMGEVQLTLENDLESKLIKNLDELV